MTLTFKLIMKQIKYNEWKILNNNLISNVITNILNELEYNKEIYNYYYDSDLLEKDITKYLYNSSDNKYELY
jgi:hypothetical protein